VTDPSDTSTTSSLSTGHAIVTWMTDLGTMFGSGCAVTGVTVPGGLVPVPVGLEAAGGLEAVRGEVGRLAGRLTCPVAIVEG